MHNYKFNYHEDAEKNSWIFKSIALCAPGSINILSHEDIAISQFDSHVEKTPVRFYWKHVMNWDDAENWLNIAYITQWFGR